MFILTIIKVRDKVRKMVQPHIFLDNLPKN